MEKTGGGGMVDSNNVYENKEVNMETFLKWCSVSLGNIVSRGKRLEASVYDVEAKQARQLIKSGKFPITTIGGEKGLATSYTGARFKRIWVKKSDLPIYQPSAIVDIKPTPDGYISHLTKTNIEALRVKKGQVLMTCSGTIGKVSYVSETLDHKIFSHDLLRIDCKDAVDQGYIYTYLKSKIGNKILLTNSYGAVITHIEPEHLATVPIPNASQDIKKKIHDLVVRSYGLRDESNRLIDEGMKLLVQELNLPEIDVLTEQSVTDNEEIQSFSVKLSDLEGRVDASYHIPIVKTITEHLREYAKEVTTLGNPDICAEIILPGRFKRVYVEEGYGRVFIGGKQLGELDPSNKKYLSLVHHKDRITKQLELHENMTLITCSGTIGKVVLVGKQWEDWTANQHIIRVVPASKDIAGYIYVFLLSDYGHQLITHYTYGSVVDEIDDNHVRQIPIPLLKNKGVQDKINLLVLSANEKRYEAYKLEQEAVEIMDNEVIYSKKNV